MLFYHYALDLFYFSIWFFFFFYYYFLFYLFDNLAGYALLDLPFRLLLYELIFAFFFRSCFWVHSCRSVFPVRNCFSFLFHVASNVTFLLWSVSVSVIWKSGSSSSLLCIDGKLLISIYHPVTEKIRGNYSCFTWNIWVDYFRWVLSSWLYYMVIRWRWMAL